jgi:hypothetical protein
MPEFRDRFVMLPEAVFSAVNTGVSPNEKLFQRMMVNIQMYLEDAVDRALGPEDNRAIICHRGSLDPLAYWIKKGWDEEEFFKYTGMSIGDYYARYDLVIHLVTAADGALRYYKRWPDAHRIEFPEEAVSIDISLRRIWGGHPRFYLIDNADKGWDRKAAEASGILKVNNIDKPYELK